MTTPAPAPAAQPQQQDARGYMFQILLSDGVTWQEIEAITEFSVDRSEGEEEAETVTFQDAGQYKSEKMQRGATCELTARPKATPQTGAPTPGRARVKGLERRLGFEGLGRYRFRHIWDQVWEQWDVWVGEGETSGETNDKAEWECTFHRHGAERFFDVTSGTERFFDADGKLVPAAP